MENQTHGTTATRFAIRPFQIHVPEEDLVELRQRLAMTRPQIIGYSLADSPVGLAAWMLDHDARSYEQISHAFEGHPAGDLTRDEILDNITLYWLTHTETSSLSGCRKKGGRLLPPPIHYAASPVTPPTSLVCSTRFPVQSWPSATRTGGR